MPANVRRMMYVGEVPWHGQGVHLEKPPTAAEAIHAAGLDWTADRERIFRLREGVPVEILEYRAITSGDRVFGVMSGRYTPVQNVEAFSAFDPLVRDGLLTYETAGELHGGIVWVLAKADGTMLKDVDPIHKYLLLVNSFDGSTALRVRFTPIRVVCQNTLSMALGRPQAEAYSLRHMASVKLRMQEAFAALRMALSRFDEAEQQFQRMMERIINEEERTWYYHQVVPGDSKQADETRRILAHVATRDTQAATDSLWAAYNSVTWHIDHRACGKDRLKASWFGQGASMRQRATSAALELCERR